MVTAGLYDINIIKGTDFSIDFHFPYNVNNHYSFESKIRDNDNNEVIEFTTTHNNDGHLILSLTEAQTETIEGEGLVYDIIQTQTQTGFVSQVIKGNVIIETSVTLNV
jgi:hypothetical protein